MIRATAPGKVILFGEHAVVYGRPAIAIPLSQIRAVAEVEDRREKGVLLIAPDIGTSTLLDDAAVDDPLAAALRQLGQAIGLRRWPRLRVTVSSQIPIASGLGSGAAITAAVIRAAADYLGLSEVANDEWVSSLTYEVEKIYHGTPSGIDNTVIAYEQPVYFVRQQPRNRVETFHVATPLHLLIADSGLRSSTKVVVGDVRRQWLGDTRRFEALFDQCAQIADAGRAAIENGDLPEIGRLMTANHEVLKEMTVSSAVLDALVTAANSAGALGAKLSGAGRGGNIIALATAEAVPTVRQSLLVNGACNVLTTVLR